ncbi:MAG TPA: OsmC family protein [Candidatus Dormibacteraeota bacterium]
MTTATVRWTGDRTSFDIEGGSGFHAQADSDAPGAADEAIHPTELLLGALGACTGVNAVLLLQKMRQPLRSLEIRVDGDRETEWPKAFTAIRIEFVLGWSGPTDDALVEKALDQSVNRYCPVHATLAHGVEISHRRTDS